MLGAALLACGCAAFRAVDHSATTPDADIYHGAEAERAGQLEREIEQFKADLREAEGALIAIESGLRGPHIRAEAVSALAEARVEVERAADAAPWRPAIVAEARSKLEEAERQLAAGHLGVTIFLASRASRIAGTLLREAARAAQSPGARLVRAKRANLRAEPSRRGNLVAVLPRGLPVFPERTESSWILVRTASGPVGWVHASVLSRP